MTFKAAFFGVLAACAASAANAQTILKFAHADQQNSARHAGVTLFAQKVEELTQGRYKVQVYCCGQLGSDPKVIEQLGLQRRTRVGTENLRHISYIAISEIEPARTQTKSILLNGTCATGRN